MGACGEGGEREGTYELVGEGVWVVVGWLWGGLWPFCEVEVVEDLGFGECRGGL